MLATLGRIGRAAPTWVWLLAVVAVHVAAVAHLTRDGMVVSHDGVRYLEMARSFRAGDFALGPSADLPYGRLHWPPVYPALIAVLSSVTGLEPTRSAFVVNLASALLLALGTQKLVRAVWPARARLGPWPALLVAYATTSATTIRMSAHVLPEVTFAAGIVWLLAWTATSLRAPSWPTVLAGAGIGAVVVATRWAGAFVLVGSVLVVGLSELRQRRLPRRAAVLGGLAALPVAAWVLWLRSRPADRLSNHGRTGVLSLPVSAVESVIAFGSQSLGMFQGRSGGIHGRGTFAYQPGVAGAAFLASLLVGLLLLSGFAWVLATTIRENVGRRATPHRPLDPMLGLLVPVTTYAVLIHLTRARWGYFVLPRYWGITPVLVWTALGAAVARRGRGPWPRLVTAACALVLLVNVAFTIYLLR